MEITDWSAEIKSASCSLPDSLNFSLTAVLERESLLPRVHGLGRSGTISFSPAINTSRLPTDLKYAPASINRGPTKRPL